MPHETAVPARATPGPIGAEEAAWLAELLAVVRERKGLDFSGYRMPTLLRRARNRMLAANIQSPAAYSARLRAEPAEADALVERFTIKVSKFFRDPPTFDAIARALAPASLERRGHALKVWSAGCAQGEEPYSLAILLGEHGTAAAPPRVFATDIDGAAIAFARRGHYKPDALVNVPPHLRSRYFDEARPESGCAVKGEKLCRVDFSLHDLAGIQPPPADDFDLVCCRNVLIYMQPALQERVVRLLLSSLAPGGLLCLGEAEWLPARLGHHFEVVDRRARLFRRLNITSTEYVL